MSGIVGYIKKGKNKEKIIKKMAKRIEHRGPDDASYYVDDNIALAQRTLATYPITDDINLAETKRNVIVSNSTIYNYDDIKKKIGEVKYKTDLDSELILHGYEKYGLKISSMLRGMFSFAIWDKEKEELFCSRDHFGIKPFYYYWDGETFLFASEIKSFLDNPNFKKELNEKLLRPYLSFSYTPTEETFFKNVYRLNPGHNLTFSNNKVKIDKYFNVDFKEKNNSFDKVVNNIDKVMKNSINAHLKSKVEIGSLLSSGVDSSYIVSVVKPDKTYTAGYDNKRYNESFYAKELADILKINNKVKLINKEEYLKVIPKIMYHMDEPLADPSAVALYFVAKEASKDVKVVLSGEGADEFFGGYNSYQDQITHQSYNKIPFFIRNNVAKAFQLFPNVKGASFFIRRGLMLEDYYIGVNRVFSEKEANDILISKNKITNKEITNDIFKKNKNNSNITKMQAIDINFWLMKDILHKADRMTMAASVEARSPFIDKEVFKVARTLKDNQKINEKTTKVTLREAAKKSIPNESYNKKKLGFPVPLRDWLKEDLFYNEVKRAFNSENSAKFFDKEKIIKLLDQHQDNKKDNYKKIWTVYSFIIWYEEFFSENKKTS